MRSTVWLLLAMTHSSAVAHAEALLPDCQVEKEAPIYFSDMQVPDRLVVSVIGSPCYSGTAKIFIYSHSGLLLYKHEQPFKPLSAYQWDDPDIVREAYRFATNTLNSAANTTRIGLPEWEPEEQFYEDFHTSLAVPKDVYQKLQHSAQMVFYHSTYYEGGVHVVFDKEQGLGRVVLRGGS